MTSPPPAAPNDRAESGDPGEAYLASLDEPALDALVEAMTLVASADGVISPLERQRLAESVAGLTRGRLAADETAHRLAQIQERAAQASRPDRLASLAERLPDPMVRRVALVLAADIAAADGVLHEAEYGLCVSLAEALGVDAAELDALGIRATLTEPL